MVEEESSISMSFKIRHKYGAHAKRSNLYSCDPALFYLLWDGDTSYGPAFRDPVRVMGIKEVVTDCNVVAPAESIRLDHLTIFDGHHLSPI